MRASSSDKVAAAGTLAFQEVDRKTISRKLSVGATLSARILESHGSRKYTVGFSGLRMIAESSQDLPVGSRINVQVAALEPKIHFRIISPGKQGLEEILRNLGFEKPTESQKQVVEEMIARGLPLDRESLKDAMAAMKKNLSPKDAVRLIQNKLPLSEASIDRLKAAQQSPASLLVKLTEVLNERGKGEISHQIQSSLTFTSDLKELFAKHPLKQERRLLQSSPKEDAKSLLIELTQSPDVEVAARATDLLSTLEGRYLLGVPEPHIPFVVDDNGPKDASVAAERTPEVTHVRFSLDTSKLGQVVGVVDFQMSKGERVLGISVGVDEKDFRKPLLDAAPQLIESLKALGFSVNALAVDVINRSKSPRTPVTGLDFKV